MSITRRVVLTSGLTLAAAHAAGVRPATWLPRNTRPGVAFAGVNLAGAEFGSAIPGQHTIDYFYPSAADVAYFAGLGFNCLRVPFRWERLQPELYGEFDAAERARLEALAGEITGRGLTVILDPHNFAKRRVRADDWSAEHMIGQTTVPYEAFAEFWGRLATLFKGDDRVVLGLMNEPADIEAGSWLSAANLATQAIRAAGAKNLILVPGTAYSGAHSWRASGNEVLSGFKDPEHRFAIEVHQYLDADSSGTSPVAVSGSCGSERLQEFQSWARRNGFKAFLGEFGGADNPAALNALADICQEMSANTDVWIGWTAWAAGPYWPADYMFNLGPAPSGAERAPTKLLASYASPRNESFWTTPGSSIDLDLVRDRVHGCKTTAAALAFARPREVRKGQLGEVVLKGPLAALLRAPAFTLLVETTGLEAPAADCEIASASGRPFLIRDASGALRFEGRAQTQPSPLPSWRTRRRCAVSVAHAVSEVTISATGCGSAACTGEIAPFASAMLSAGPTGRIVRVTGFETHMTAEELERLVA